MQTISTSDAALLTGDHLDTSAGCEVLNLDLTIRASVGVAGDISDDLVADGSRVEHHAYATIHGTCTLQLSTELDWGSVLVRPYLVLADAGVTRRWPLGVYMLTTPAKQVGTTPVTFTAQGLDRLSLLARDVGADYTVVTGTTYRAAILQAFTDAGLTGVIIDGSAADSTLPVDKTWSLVARSTDPDQTSTPVTWLRVINDLLGAINFAGVSCDENGLYRCQRYLEPAVRPPEFVFDADDELLNIVGEDRTLTADVWNAPNRWVFLWKNRPGGMSSTEGDGKYTVNNVSDGPTSQSARDLVWTKVYEYDAASQAVLVTIGDRRVADDRRVTTQIKAKTGPFPPAGHFDVATYNDDAAGGTRKVLGTDWVMPLDGGDVEWQWEAI